MVKIVPIFNSTTLTDQRAIKAVDNTGARQAQGTDWVLFNRTLGSATAGGSYKVMNFCNDEDAARPAGDRHQAKDFLAKPDGELKRQALYPPISSTPLDPAPDPLEIFHS